MKNIALNVNFSVSLLDVLVNVKTISVISGLAVAHYLQSVSKRVALGAELAYQFGPQVPGNEIALLSVAGRYDGKFLICFS